MTALEGESENKRIAKAAMSPEIGNAAAAVDWSLQMFPDLHLTECVDILRTEAEKVKRGDLSKMEATLVAQAQTLDSIFTNLATRAAHTQSLPLLEGLLRLAFKAQAQARSTVEVLYEMKYPKLPTFVGQQNIANQQQVNNATSTYAHVRGIRNNENELMEAGHGKRLDYGTAQASGRADPGLATMGKIDRRTISRRQG